MGITPGFVCVYLRGQSWDRTGRGIISSGGLELSPFPFPLCKSFSHVQLFVTLWSVTHKATLSVRFSRQEYWSGFPGASPGDLPNPGIEHRYPALQADSFPSESPGSPEDTDAFLCRVFARSWILC